MVLKLNFIISPVGLPSGSSCIRHLAGKTSGIQTVEDLPVWYLQDMVVDNRLAVIEHTPPEEVHKPLAVEYSMTVLLMRQWFMHLLRCHPVIIVTVVDVHRATIAIVAAAVITICGGRHGGA